MDELVIQPLNSLVNKMARARQRDQKSKRKEWIAFSGREGAASKRSIGVAATPWMDTLWGNPNERTDLLLEFCPGGPVAERTQSSNVFSPNFLIVSRKRTFKKPVSQFTLKKKSHAIERDSRK